MGAGFASFPRMVISAADFLPAVIIGFLVFILFTIPGLPLVGLAAGGVAFVGIAAGLVGPLLLGAIVGGALA